mmetsp:Transcript_60499/g.160858  ORF Transcript_60499/g.160858 Transcript_60499/m.160858 type:complete len:203 (+) Transcript_60499:928-1536(+)
MRAMILSISDTTTAKGLCAWIMATTLRSDATLVAPGSRKSLSTRVPREPSCTDNNSRKDVGTLVASTLPNFEKALSVLKIFTTLDKASCSTSNSASRTFHSSVVLAQLFFVVSRISSFSALSDCAATKDCRSVDKAAPVWVMVSSVSCRSWFIDDREFVNPAINLVEASFFAPFSAVDVSKSCLNVSFISFKMPTISPDCAE